MSERIDKVLIAECRRHLPAGGSILDLPSGAGKLSRSLSDVGFNVTSADLFPPKLSREGVHAIKANMNHRLPFPDSAFDGLVCQEGVEHLENPAAFLQECRRVTHSNGILWLTTPNFLDLSSRLAFFLTGMKSFHGGFPNEETTVWGEKDRTLYHGHAFTLPFFQLRYLLRLAQFEIKELRGLNRSRTSTLLYPWTRPIAWALIARAQRRRTNKKKRAVSKNLYQELRNHALSRDLLLYRKILVRAVRNEGSFVPPS